MTWSRACKVVFAELPLTPAFANHTEPPGRRRSLPTCWPQLRSDEDFPQPHRLAKRYVRAVPLSFPFVITRVRTPVSRAAGGWIGVEELSTGPDFGDSITSRLDLPGRAFPLATSPSLVLSIVTCPSHLPICNSSAPYRPPAPTSPDLKHILLPS